MLATRDVWPSLQKYLFPNRLYFPVVIGDKQVSVDPHERELMVSINGY